MQFTAEIRGTSTTHCGQFDGGDSTSVSLSIQQKDVNHQMTQPRFEIVGPAEEMQKFVDAHRECQSQVNPKHARARITIDLEGPEEQGQAQTSPIPVTPFIDLVLVGL